MNKTARTYNTHPRLVIVSSGVHYWTEVEPAVRATPSILETISSKAYCVDQYALSFSSPGTGLTQYTGARWRTATTCRSS
jgi:hypothetical protein